MLTFGTDEEHEDSARLGVELLDPSLPLLVRGLTIQPPVHVPLGEDEVLRGNGCMDDPKQSRG